MITAVDSSVLWAIINHEKDRASWIKTLAGASSEGTLIVCPVAFAELAPAGGDAAALAENLGNLGIKYDPISQESAHLAGTTFKRYRQAGGPREHLIPDFLIAAHAMLQADRLAAVDRGYLKTWFSGLTLLQPA